MPILDFFKKKFKEDKSSPHPSPSKEGLEKKEEKEVKKVAEVKVEKKEKKTRKKKKVSFLAPRVLKEPHITEKATNLAGENKYVFKIYSQANKNQIKKAIEELYGVRVEEVRVINISRKPRRLGKTPGFKKGYKKAIVTIKKGQKIEVIPK